MGLLETMCVFTLMVGATALALAMVIGLIWCLVRIIWDSKFK